MGFFKKSRRSISYRILSSFMAFLFVLTSTITPSYGQVVPKSLLNMPIPGTMVSISDEFTPAIIRGMTIYPNNPLMFDFIVDRGNSGLSGVDLKDEASDMIKYFLASLTVPEDELWVNLSPYEKDRILGEGLGKTAMGRDLLAQDYVLKQVTASLMYPEDELGAAFWERVYEKAYEEHGITDIPVNTFNKVWIVPEEAIVYEHEASAYVVGSHLKVMLEEDYIAMEHADRRGLIHQTQDKGMINHAPTHSNITTSVIRDILLPAIEREVNEGKNFAKLRQVYNAMILAAWYKRNLRESLLGQVYMDQNKTAGVETDDKHINQKIYDQYIESFKKGVYDYIKEDYDPATQQIVPRKYFSGGEVYDALFNKDASVLSTVNDASLLTLPQLKFDSAMKALEVLNQDIYTVSLLEVSDNENDLALLINQTEAKLVYSNEVDLDSSMSTASLEGQKNILEELWGIFNRIEGIPETFEFPFSYFTGIGINREVVLKIVNKILKGTGYEVSDKGNISFVRINYFLKENIHETLSDAISQFASRIQDDFMTNKLKIMKESLKKNVTGKWKLEENKLPSVGGIFNVNEIGEEDVNLRILVEGLGEKDTAKIHLAGAKVKDLRSFVSRNQKEAVKKNNEIQKDKDVIKKIFQDKVNEKGSIGLIFHVTQDKDKDYVVLPNDFKNYTGMVERKIKTSDEEFIILNGKIFTFIDVKIETLLDDSMVASELNKSLEEVKEMLNTEELSDYEINEIDKEIKEVEDSDGNESLVFVDAAMQTPRFYVIAPFLETGKATRVAIKEIFPKTVSGANVYVYNYNKTKRIDLSGYKDLLINSKTKSPYLSNVTLIISKDSSAYRLMSNVVSTYKKQVTKIIAKLPGGDLKSGNNYEEFLEQISAIDEIFKDSAMKVVVDKTGKPVGGIDLNPAMLNLQIKRDGSGVPLPMPMQDVDLGMRVDGFVPIIFKAVPVPSMLPRLGLSESDLNRDYTHHTPSSEADTLPIGEMSFGLEYRAKFYREPQGEDLEDLLMG